MSAGAASPRAFAERPALFEDGRDFPTAGRLAELPPIVAISTNLGPASVKASSSGGPFDGPAADPRGGLAAEPAFASFVPSSTLPRNEREASAAGPETSPFESVGPAPAALDPDLIADLVNDALVAQALRFGVDLS